VSHSRTVYLSSFRGCFSRKFRRAFNPLIDTLLAIYPCECQSRRGLLFFFVCYSASLQRNVFGARGTATLKLPVKCDQRDSQRTTGIVSDSNRSMPRRATRRDRDISQSRVLSLTTCTFSRACYYFSALKTDKNYFDIFFL